MATVMKRDYSLTGRTNEKAIALDDDHLEDRVEAAWWHPVLPRETLKALMQRSDSIGIQRFALWIILLVGSGYLAVLSWGTWWAIPAFLIYGTIYSSSDAAWHECGHGTAFKSRWLNDLFYHISSFMTLREAYLWRWSHSRHHTHTYIVNLDPEIQVQRPADLLKILMDFFYLRSGPPEVWRIIRHAAGKPTADVLSFMPEDELWKMYWSSRIYVAIVAGFGVWSLAIGSFLPMMFVALPRFYGGWLHQLLGLTQHAGLAENVYDHRENTRTVYINPVFRFLYMNMNYHIEHHSTPMIPFHALPKYHEAIKDQTPTAYPSLWACYQEMIPALIKQTTNPDYRIIRDIPGPRFSPTGVAAAVADQRVAEKTSESVPAQWVEACTVDTLPEQDVVGFNHNGKEYAVYRLAGDHFYASDGICTHEKEVLSGGFIVNGCIECPRHNGRFDVTTGQAAKAPARKPLTMFPAERRGDKVFIFIP